MSFDQVFGRSRLAYNDEGTHEAVKNFFTASDLSIRLVNQDKVVGFIFTIAMSLVVSLFLPLLDFWQVLLHPLSSFDGPFLVSSANWVFLIFEESVGMAPSVTSMGSIGFLA